MARHAIPRVIDDHLLPPTSANASFEPIQVGSETWYVWLNGPLCDAVRERDDSQGLLKLVERTNLFLVALDDERQWYRYHHLFAEVLRIRLKQLQPNMIPEFHSRASRWYEQHKLFDEAVSHALALQARGDHAGAMSALSRALALAEPEGYIRLFLDEGGPMFTLLRQAYQQKISSSYVETLLKASGELMTDELRHSATNPRYLVEPLTAREREVLRLLVEGASNREIAEHLVLSVNTVKKHVTNICGKMGVRSRARAIAQARNLDLLPGVCEKV